MEAASSISMSTSSYAAGQSAPVASMGSTGSTGSTSAASAASSSSSSSVYNSVNTMLTEIGGGAADNEMLKTAIALLILNMLMKGDSQKNVGDLMGALAAGMLMQGGHNGGMSMMTMESTSTSMTVEQTASSSYASNAYSSGGAQTAAPGAPAASASAGVSTVA